MNLPSPSVCRFFVLTNEPEIQRVRAIIRRILPEAEFGLSPGDRLLPSAKLHRLVTAGEQEAHKIRFESDPDLCPGGDEYWQRSQRWDEYAGGW